MICSRCGKQNRDGVAACEFCGAPVGAPQVDIVQPGQSPKPAGISWLAIAALVLALLGVPTVGFAAVLGIILGSAALSEIKKSNGTLKGKWMAISALVVCGLTVVILPILLSIHVSKETQRRCAASCLSNLRLLGIATSMYSQDYDDHFPPVSTWCDAVNVDPYTKKPEVFVCPTARDLRCGYAYNMLLEGKVGSDLASPQDLVTLFDATGGWNQFGGMELAAKRHSGGLNVVYADGRARWVTTLEDSSLKPTLRVRKHQNARRSFGF